MQKMIIINASNVLTDKEAAFPIPMMQKQLDTQVIPAWGSAFVPMELHFGTMADLPGLAADDWVTFLNRHSSDIGALGWHTQEGRKIYGRCFVGDCKQYGLEWTVDLQHELIETGGDPSATKVYRMPNGTLAAVELCDAVEADEQAVIIDGVKLSNFVLPSYFSDGGASKYDYQGSLGGPCDALTDGGYMSLLPRGAPAWTMKQQSRRNGLAGRRFQMRGYRRVLRNVAITKTLENGIY